MKRRTPTPSWSNQLTRNGDLSIDSVPPYLSKSYPKSKIVKIKAMWGKQTTIKQTNEGAIILTDNRLRHTQQANTTTNAKLA